MARVPYFSINSFYGSIEYLFVACGSYRFSLLATLNCMLASRDNSGKTSLAPLSVQASIVNILGFH